MKTGVLLMAHGTPASLAEMPEYLRIVRGGRPPSPELVEEMTHNYRAIGGSFERRWQRMDEQVARMRGIWAGDPPFEGADPVGPRPVQDPLPVIAGVMGPKAIARAARWAVEMSPSVISPAISRRRRDASALPFDAAMLNHLCAVT